MFGRGKRTGHRALSDARLLRMEPLESRDLLSGVVNVVTTAFPVPPAFPGGALPALVAGDLLLAEVEGPDVNQVEIRSTGVENQFQIIGVNGTQLQKNGDPLPVGNPQRVIVDDIDGNIYVNLGGSGDTFRFLPESDTVDSQVPNDLYVISEYGDTVEIGDYESLSDSGVIIQGQLAVGGREATSGFSTLKIRNAVIGGSTIVRNAPGGSLTEIDDSYLRGDAGAPGVALKANEGTALALTNLGGRDTVKVGGQTEFGTDPAEEGFVVTIANGNDGSIVVFDGSAQFDGDDAPAADAHRVSVLGALSVDSDDNGVGILEQVWLKQVDVAAGVLLEHAGTAGGSRGGSSVMLTDSTLGFNLLPPGATGKPVVIANGDGPDSFVMVDSAAPWGVFALHTLPDTGDSASSNTAIQGSEIGAAPFAAAADVNDFINTAPLTVAEKNAIKDALKAVFTDVGDALLVRGGKGRDTVEVVGTQITGRARIELHNGKNELTLGTEEDDDDGNDPIVIASLIYNNVAGSGAHNDYVTLRDIAITAELDLEFGAGIKNVLELLGLTELPSFPGTNIAADHVSDNILKRDPEVLPKSLWFLDGDWEEL